MIKLHISNHNYDMNPKVVAYVEKKIFGLDKYLPRQNKDTEGTVRLIEDPSGREDNHFVCEATILVPGPDLQAKEATTNIYAAIDIVEAKLKVQAIKYKDKHMPRSRGRKMVERLLKRDDYA